jgi:putative ubiquitin-RnfH superfamily antitoxin RatB of RatAB toxin-antitoxin module
MFEICDSGFVVMKKVLTGVIVLMAIAFVLGVSWGKLFKRGYTQDENGVELAKRDSTIEQLQDSIRVMQAKLGVYEQAVKWFRNADEDELQRGIEQIRSVPNDVPLP